MMGLAAIHRLNVAFVQVRKRLDAKKRSTAGVIILTVPYGTDLFCWRFQALKCLGTFIQSLRDKSTSKRTPLRHRWFQV